MVSTTTAPPTTEFIGDQVLIRFSKALLVLSRAQFTDALKADKRWRRRVQRSQRLAHPTREITS